MIIWKPQVSEYLQCVKQLTNEVDKNAVVVVRTNYCREEIVGHVQHNISMIVFMFFFLPYCTPLICTLQIFATRKCDDHEGEYGLEIPENSNFYRPKNGH